MIPRKPKSSNGGSISRRTGLPNSNPVRLRCVLIRSGILQNPAVIPVPPKRRFQHATQRGQRVMAEPMSQDAKKSDTEFDDGLGDWRYRARHFIRPTSPTDTRLRVASAIGAFVSAAGDTFEFPDFYAPAIYLSAAITADKAAK